MEKKSQEISWEEYSGVGELKPAAKKLFEKAREISASAYAPYSRFYVGAALELEDGTIITGNNQENAAYPSGLCAERVAIFYAHAHHPKKPIKRIAVFATLQDGETGDSISPCGACRQAMVEYEIKQQSPIEVIMGTSSGVIRIFSDVRSLLPLVFYEENLKK